VYRVIFVLTGVNPVIAREEFQMQGEKFIIQREVFVLLLQNFDFPAVDLCLPEKKNLFQCEKTKLLTTNFRMYYLKGAKNGN